MHILTIIAIAMILSAAIGYGVASLTTSSPLIHSLGGVGPLKSVSSARVTTTTPTLNLSGALIYQMGASEPNTAWLNTPCQSIYLTSSDGRSWRTASPPYLTGHGCGGIDTDTVDMVGNSDVWIAFNNIIGLNRYGSVCNQGSDRGGAIDGSDDGGKTWWTVTLPDCGSDAGYMSLSFLTGEVGYAFGNAMLFRTSDGGRQWLLVAKTPFSLGMIHFISLADGYATELPVSGGPANGLYKTVDGGRTWSLVDAPSAGTDQLTSVTYGNPSFFGADSIVWPIQVEHYGTDETRVEVSSDGGAKWSSTLLPVNTGSTVFSAGSRSAWYAASDKTQISTANSGRTWTITRLKTSPTLVSLVALDFASVNNGWALITSRNAPPHSRATVLLRTTNGGRSWSVISRNGAS